MFQKPAFGSNTSGFGSFNAGTSATTPFGGFKTNTNTSAFGAPPAFGASTSAQPATGGGLFGAAQPSTSLFGNTSASTSAPPFGASTSGFGFGGGASTSTGLFAQPNTSGGLFSNTQNNSAFGAKPSGFGFGNTATSATTTGGLFGSTQNTGTSLFGQQNTSIGGGLFSNNTNTFGQQAPTGTAHVKYNPAVGTDVVVKGGTSQNVIIKHHCITCMKEYENKSLEELRLEDYTAGRKGTQGGGVFGGFQATTENKPLFGGSTFGQPATTSAPSVFGGGGLNTSTGFGQTNTFSFGNNAQNTTNTTGGLFGAAKPAFGAPATSGTGLFGAASTQPSTFGTNTSTFGFGANTQNQTTGLFGAKPATTGFGAPATSGFGGFGAASTAPSLFGAKPQQTTAPAFGTATPWLSVAELMRLELSAYMLEVRLLRNNMGEMHDIRNGITDIKNTLNRISTRIDTIETKIARTSQVSELEERAQNLSLNDRNHEGTSTAESMSTVVERRANEARKVDADSQTNGSPIQSDVVSHGGHNTNPFYVGTERSSNISTVVTANPKNTTQIDMFKSNKESPGQSTVVGQRVDTRRSDATVELINKPTQSDTENGHGNYNKPEVTERLRCDTLSQVVGDAQTQTIAVAQVADSSKQTDTAVMDNDGISKQLIILSDNSDDTQSQTVNTDQDIPKQTKSAVNLEDSILKEPTMITGLGDGVLRPKLDATGQGVDIPKQTIAESHVGDTLREPILATGLVNETEAHANDTAGHRNQIIEIAVHGNHINYTNRETRNVRQTLVAEDLNDNLRQSYHGYDTTEVPNVTENKAEEGKSDDEKREVLDSGGGDSQRLSDIIAGVTDDVRRLIVGHDSEEPDVTKY